jgi:hypothetical protein
LLMISAFPILISVRLLRFHILCFCNVLSATFTCRKFLIPLLFVSFDCIAFTIFNICTDIILFSLFSFSWADVDSVFDYDFSMPLSSWLSCSLLEIRLSKDWISGSENSWPTLQCFTQ